MVIDHLLVVLGFFLLVLVAGNDGDGTIRIVCHDATDYHSLMYETCRREPVCAHLYHLKLLTTTADSTNQTIRLTTREFRKFAAQIKRLPLFQRANVSTTALSPRSAPLVSISYDSGTPVNCTSAHGSIKSSATTTGGGTVVLSNQLFTLTAVMAMQNYKMFATDEPICATNEQLVLNAEGQLVCLCLRGKVCTSDANFSTILLVLVIFLLVAIALWIPSQFLTLHIITQRLYTIAGGAHK